MKKVKKFLIIIYILWTLFLFNSLGLMGRCDILLPGAFCSKVASYKVVQQLRNAKVLLNNFVIDRMITSTIKSANINNLPAVQFNPNELFLSKAKDTMINDISGFLRKNNIEYIVNDTTLIGAINSKSTMPFDNTLQIAVKEEDLKSFVNFDIKQSLSKLGYVSIPYGIGYKIVKIPSQSVINGGSGGDIGSGIKNIVSNMVTLDIGVIKQVTPFSFAILAPLTFDENDKKNIIEKKDLYPLKKYNIGSGVVYGPHNPFSYLDKKHPHWDDFENINFRNLKKCYCF